MDLHAVWKVMQRSLRPKSSFSQCSPLTRLSDKITTRKLTCTIDLPNLLRCRQLVLHALMCVRECLYLVLCIFITGRFAWPPPWSRYRMVPSQRSPVPPFHKHGHLLPSSLLSLNYGNHSFSCLYNSVTLRMSYKWGQTVDTLSIVFFFFPLSEILLRPIQVVACIYSWSFLLLRSSPWSRYTTVCFVFTHSHTKGHLGYF